MVRGCGQPDVGEVRALVGVVTDPEGTLFLGGLTGTRPDRNDYVVMVIGGALAPVDYEKFQNFVAAAPSGFEFITLGGELLTLGGEILYLEAA